MDRPTIADLARAAGVSISTVDRALNGRDPVRRQTAERVLMAARAIGFHAAGLIGQRLKTEQPERTFGFLLQQRSSHFYQELGEALNEATKACASVRGRAIIQYLDDLTPASVSDHLARLASEVDAIGVVAADHPHVTNAIDPLQRGGVPVFALISALTAPGRAGYIGLDNWKVGRTAAWAVSRLARHPGKVGIFVGNHRYLCQDFCEMSFRSYFREHAPDFHILEALISLEEPRLAYENTLDLLSATKTSSACSSRAAESRASSRRCAMKASKCSARSPQSVSNGPTRPAQVSSMAL